MAGIRAYTPALFETRQIRRDALEETLDTKAQRIWIRLGVHVHPQYRAQEEGILREAEAANTGIGVGGNFAGLERRPGHCDNWRMAAAKLVQECLHHGALIDLL